MCQYPIMGNTSLISEYGTKKIREKILPELPNLTAYEDYNTIERHKCQLFFLNSFLFSKRL